MVSINEAIHEYMGRGWSIIPIRAGDKRPLVRWEEFQHRHPSEAEARGWLRQWAEAGIGVVTGAISGLVVVDVDAGHGGNESLEQLEREHGPMPTTVKCGTGGGGRHFYFAHPGGVVRNKIGLAPGVDIRADGGYVVAPPSLHASGSRAVPRRAARSRPFLTGYYERPSKKRRDAVTRSLTGDGSFAKASRWANATTRSRLWPGTCSGTAWTRLW